MQSKTSYSRLFLIKILSDLFTTNANGNDVSIKLMIENNVKDPTVINQICEVLVETCKSGEILSISYALDAFYEIFSENYYDSVLKEHNVIPLMQ